MKRHIHNYATAVLGLVLFSTAMLVMHSKLREYHYHDILEQLRLLPGKQLLMAFALTILDYLVLTAYDALALRYIKQPIKYSRTALASFMGYAFSHNMTFLGGSAVRYRIYSAFGVSASKVAKVVAFCAATFWLGFLSVGSAVFLFSSETIPKTVNLPFVTVRPIGAIFLIIITAYVTLSLVKRTPLRLRQMQFEIPSPELVMRQLIVSSVDWILAGSVLYVLLPQDGSADFASFLSIFLLAQLAGLVSYVPGGLGIFETSILLLLSPFYEPSTLIGSLLVYRVLYYWAPFGVASILLAGLEFLFTRHRLTRIAAGFGQMLAQVLPNVLATTTFVAGVVLLVSGALPASRTRMEWLLNFLPLPAIELSHFLCSLTGAILLILARAIQRKAPAAYYLTIILLLLGIIFSILKGLDYEEALILLLFLVIMLPCRGNFEGEKTLFGEPAGITWIILILSAVILSIWIGLFAYKHIEYSSSLWLRAAADGDVSRFIRASAGAIFVVIAYTMTNIFRRSKKH